MEQRLSETLFTVANLQGTEGAATPAEIRALAADCQRLEREREEYRREMHEFARLLGKAKV